MDQLRFLEQLGTELAWRGVSGYRVKRNGPWGRLNLHRGSCHLRVKLYKSGKLKVEICCDGADSSPTLATLAPICRELQTCMGEPGREERVDGIHRIRWTFCRHVDPGSEQGARHWAADFLEAGWPRMAKHQQNYWLISD